MNFQVFFMAAECCLAFFVALLASLMITPAVRGLSEEWGFVDRPDGGRKAHARPVALGGGVAVLLACLAAVGVTFAAASARQVSLEEQVVDLFHQHRSTAANGPADAQTLAVESKIAEQLSEADRRVDVETVRRVLAEYFADTSPEKHVFRQKYLSLVARVNQNLQRQSSPFYFGLLAASMLICAVGLVDDLVGLQGRYKLAGQVAASLVLVASGLLIEKISIFDHVYTLGILAVPFTLFWLLGAINAINLLDGIDGLATTVGIVLAATLVGLSLLLPQFHQPEVIIALVLAGALLGFLRFNFAPASIFLGDSGSMLIGLVVGALAIRSSFKTEATVALAVPFALWAIPIFDSAAAILRRKLTGRSLFATDRGHLHHTLLVRGWTVRQAVLFIGLICALTSTSAVLSLYLQREPIAWISVLAVIAFLMLMGIFGHIEFALVRDRVRLKTLALTRRNGGGAKQAHESRIRLQGSQEWDHLWTALTESAENHDLVRIDLTLNLPALNEAFYANWQRSAAADPDTTWRMTCPLIAGGQPVGSLVVMGVSSEGTALSHMGQIADFLEPAEETILKMVAEISAAKRPEVLSTKD